MENIYSIAMQYESFMKKVFNAYIKPKSYMESFNMQNLILAEKGSNDVKHLPPFDKQLEQVKKYLNKAFDKLLSKKMDMYKLNKLKFLKDEMNNAYSSSQLIRIINEAEKII